MARDGRPDPDLLLRQVQAEEQRARRGRLKVFLGYASGVGKTFTMLDEGRRRKKRGQDVVVGAVQTNRPPETDAILAALEVIPLIELHGKPCIDVPAILRRHPQVCLIDGLAWDNPPGSSNPHRWQDVLNLLDSGIDVVGTINLQYIAEYRDRVAAITGKRVEQVVPLSFIHSADEIAIVDAPATDALRQAKDQSGDYEHQLRALRELALLAAADVVDRQLESYLEREGVPTLWGTQERIMVCMTARSDATHMIGSGERNARRFHGELYVVYVEQPALTPEDRMQLERNLQRAREAGARIEILRGEDPVDAIIKFALEHGVTQIFIGHSQRRSLWSRLTGSPVDRLIRRAEGIDIQVFPH
ncbi:MAG TPA: universal stress protein [Bryobacteraceae bacterium]|nr:universal stress protein [Bryobacteraceae bacterium]